MQQGRKICLFLVWRPRQTSRIWVIGQTRKSDQGLNCHGRLNGRVRLVIQELKILEFKTENIFYRRIDLHRGQSKGRSC